MYSHGGTSRAEFWADRDVIAGSLDPRNAETCATYNMLKLSRMLYFHRPGPEYLEYYERGLFNYVLGSRKDAHSTESPLVTYFVGMSPGAVREFGNVGARCGGTGLESHTKYQDSVFFRSDDGPALHVNLFVPAEVTWAERGFRIVQRTRFPQEEGTTLTVEGRGRLALRIRCPRWARRGITVRVNGRPANVEAEPGSYLTLDREWRPGDRVEVAVPFTLRTESARDDRAVQSLFHGPVLLAARDAATALHEVTSLYGHARLSGDLRDAVREAPGGPSRFLLGGRTFVPFHEGADDAYHAYFRRSEPRIVFAGLDSGVRNPARPDGTDFLGRLWEGAPFGGRAEFREAVAELNEEWVADGLLTAAERATVLETARRAPMEP